MKTRKILSWILALAMALTVFSIPGSGYAEENPPQDQPGSYQTDQEGVKASEDRQQMQSSVRYYLGDGLLRFDEYGMEIDEIVLYEEDPIDYAKLNNYNSIQIFSREGDELSDCGDWAKVVWHIDNPEYAKLCYRDKDGELVVPSESEIEMTNSEYEKKYYPYVYVFPVAEGIAEFSVDIYETADASEPDATLPFRVSLTQKSIDRAKYKGYLDLAETEQANYKTQKAYGTIGNFEEYKSRWEFPKKLLTEEDLDKLKIRVSVSGKTYNAAIDKGKNTWSADLKDAELGAKVRVTYSMGSYSRQEDLLMTLRIKPKVTVKHYTYNGEYRYGNVTVTYKGKKLKKNADYWYAPTVRKDVGKASYSIFTSYYNWDNEKETRIGGIYAFDDIEGYFKINPKGTSLKSLKKGKKSITVKWKKQSAKMSEKRINGYQIQLATNKKFTKNKKLVTVKGYKKTSKKISKLKKKKKYYVRVRTYMKVKGEPYYSKWSKVKSIKTK